MTGSMISYIFKRDQKNGHFFHGKILQEEGKLFVGNLANADISTHLNPATVRALQD